MMPQTLLKIPTKPWKNAMKEPPIYAKIALVCASWAILTPIFGGYLHSFILFLWMVVRFFQRDWTVPTDATRSMDLLARPIHFGSLALVISQSLASLLSGLFSPFAQPWPKIWSASVHMGIKWALLWFVLYFSMRAFVARKWSPARIAPWFLLALSVHLVYAWFQRIYGIDWTHGWQGHLGPHRYAYGVYRVNGWHSHPLTMAYNLLLVTFAGASLASLSFRFGEKRPTLVWLGVVATAVLTILISGSRFVLLLMPLALIMVPVQYSEWQKIPRSRVILLTLAGLVVFGLGIFYLLQMDSFAGRFRELFDESRPLATRFSRLSYWSVHWAIFKDHIWWGTSMAGAEKALSAYWPLQGTTLEKMPAHNIFLQTLADTGLIGMGGLVAFFGGIFVTARRALRAIGERTGIALFGIVTLLVGVVQTNLRDSEFMMAFWFLLALHLAYVGERSSDKKGDML